MTEKKDSTATVLTGSTGNSLQDAGVRGLYAGAVNAIAFIFCWAVNTPDPVTLAIMSIVAFVSFMTGGLVDRLYRKYLS